MESKLLENTEFLKIRKIKITQLLALSTDFSLRPLNEEQ